MACYTAAYTLCALLFICSQQAVVTAAESIHLQYYTHEMRGGPNSTLLIAAGPGDAGNFASLRWGSFLVFDNMIREGLSSDSTLLGKVTGTTVLTTEDGKTVELMAQTVFNQNYKYNGSGFTVLPGGVILGGNGYFQGYMGHGKAVEVNTTATESGVYAVYLWDVYLESK